MASEDEETQQIVLQSLQAERTVVERLRAELAPPTLDFPETGGEALPGAEYEVDYVEQPAQLNATMVTTDADSGVTGDTQGTVEAVPTLEVLGSTAAYDNAPRAELTTPALCRNSDRCCQVVNLTSGLEHCCGRCYWTDAAEHSGACRWWHNTHDGTIEPSPEVTLNDVVPEPVRF